TQQGLQNAAATLWMTGERDDGLSYVGQLRVSFVKWQPSNRTTFPFQDSWTQTYYTARVWREWADDEWGWGVWLENMVQLKRRALENLTPSTMWQAGPSFSYHTKFSDEISLHASGAVLAGGDLFAIGTANSIDYVFLGRKLKPYIGADL